MLKLSIREELRVLKLRYRGTKNAEAEHIGWD